MISDLIMICGVSGVLSPGQMESLAGRIVQLEVKELKAELARLGVDCSAMVEKAELRSALLRAKLT